MQQTRLPNQYDTSWWKDTIFLTIILGGLFFILLGTRTLFVPDEGRYAEIAREMFISGDYVTPYLNHIKYFEKPILYYWLEAASIKLSGLNLWSLRGINAILGLAGCLLTYVTSRKLYDRITGLIAALILGTSMLYFVMVHMISLDLPVTIFLAATLYAFILGVLQPPGNSRRLLLWGAAVASACAVLTKGLIGLVFPGMIIFAWIAVLGEWRLLKQLYLPSCLIIFLLIAAPWHILVGQRNPEFFYFYFIEQHFLRYTTRDVGHYQPAWFFIPNLIIGFFPWIAFLPQSMLKLVPFSWQRRNERRTELFFVLWASLIFLFFSFSKSKLIPYILPVFPPLAILTARYLRLSVLNKRHSGVYIGYICLAVLSIAIACVYFALPHYAQIPDPERATLYLTLAGILLIIGMLTACYFVFRNIVRAIMITAGTAWIFLLLSLAAIPSIETRTISPLVAVITPLLTPEDDVITYNQYYQDLPFYLQRRVSILNWRNEMSYGMQHQDTHEWMIDDNTFWQRWHSNRRIFVFMGQKEFQQFQLRYPNERYYLLGKTLINVVISNQSSNPK